MALADKLSVVLGGVVGGFASLAFYCAYAHFGRRTCKPIKRVGTEDPRMSKIVMYDGRVYLSGQVGDIDKLSTSDVTAQAEQMLAKVDALLASADTSKSNILEACLWLKNMPADFKALNEVWNAWVDPDNKPTRYCVGAQLARDTILCEVSIVARL